ncbi:hypothetical protein HYU22_05605 [Candidatus Woesearchaeota archaeon]|nr:hypothetical protein [Candidatus Woesearchaeota archaeon]
MMTLEKQQQSSSDMVSSDSFLPLSSPIFHKLKKGFLGFPIGLNFKEVNKLLFERYGNIQIDNSIAASRFYSPNGTVNFFLEALLYKNSSRSDRNEKAQEKAAQQLIRAAQIADLNRCNRDKFLRLDSLDFLANYPGLVQYVLDLPEISRKEKNQALQAFQTVRAVYLTGLEIASQTRIRPTTDLLDFAADSLEEKVTALSADDPGAASLKHRIRQSLLSETKGTSYHDLQELLTVRSKKHFRQLAHERTQEILTRDQKYAGLTDRLGKELKDYSVGESVVLSCYFARNIIQHYASLNDAVRAVFSGQQGERISGKCTDYTGLALQYLREYLVPLHPEKFKNWTFGYDTEQIGGYDHCYIKAIHQRPDDFIDVYFIDPTLLATTGIQGLKTPEEVIELMDTANHPLQIVRDAEDLLRKK